MLAYNLRRYRLGDLFELKGLDPVSEYGEYFDDSRWWWHALWDYVYSICGDILTEDDYINGHRIEEGYIIDKETAFGIAERLFTSIESGECAAYEEKNTQSLQNLPDETDIDTGEKVKPEALMYPFTVENVKGFAEFCETSGGFIFVPRKD